MMSPAPLPTGEAGRLAELTDLQALQAPLEPTLTAVAQLAASICRTPIALVNLIGEHLQHLKGQIGLDMVVMDRDIAFCPYVICGRELMQVPDTRTDPRFHTDPLVAGDLGIRFYAGVPIISSRGHALGTVAVMDRRPRRLSPPQQAALSALSTCVSALIEQRHYSRQAEQVTRRLQQMDDLKQLFLRNVNHELRTPLTSIRSYLHLIHDEDGLDPATQHRFLEVIERNSDRLLEKLDELLLLASLSAQSVAFAPQSADLVTVAESAVNEAQTKAWHKHHSLTVCAPDPVPAWIDATRLHHALVHLLDNAIKFTPDGGRITVTVSADPVPSVAIHDTGIGIPDDQAERVFDDFYRTPQAETQAIGGIGVGLSIVKKIIDLHGGTVSLTYTPDEGTCVYVRLPAPLAQAAPDFPQ
ncbi:ATP-binding protein [Planobispora siamensis]|uniref:GAF domain-containing sensor histidine kinase n=1 Tax=Planobispora siamensis TaxID=936338 RepID=UPI001952540B|nr:GAF domain-containing sensor histidine kinase [Planobispora siamensis]